MKSREEPQVELIVSRNLSTTSSGAMMPGVQTAIPPAISSRRIGAQTQWRQKHEPMPIPQQPHHKGEYATHKIIPHSYLLSFLFFYLYFIPSYLLSCPLWARLIQHLVLSNDSFITLFIYFFLHIYLYLVCEASF